MPLPLHEHPKKDEGPKPPRPQPHPPLGGVERDEKPGVPHPPPPPHKNGILPPHKKHGRITFKNTLYSILIATVLALLGWLILYLLEMPTKTIAPILIVIWVTVWAPVWIGLTVRK